MTLSTILCPLDFSAASAALVAYAAALAVGTGAELRLLYVQEPVPAGQVMEPQAALSAHQQAARAAGAARVSTVLVHGEAAPAILAEAQRHQADLIVIGAHGQTGLSRFLMGNTAERVVRTAPCPTLLVRE